MPSAPFQIRTVIWPDHSPVTQPVLVILVYSQRVQLRHETAQVRLSHGDIVQMRGVSNCDPGPAGVAYMRKWAKQAGLRISPWLERALADVVA